MSATKKQYLNKSQGDEFGLPCLKCSGRTDHKVLQSVNIRGDETDEDYSVQWREDYQIVQCLGCKAISYRTEKSNSEDVIFVGNGDYEHAIYEDLYPSRIEGRRGLEDETHYLPANVRRIYEETWVALKSRSPVLSGIGLRALLETVCKEKNAAGRDLIAKIDDLARAGILTPASANILHKIRTLGNAAAHEVKPHSEKQLGLAMDIIEHLLKDVYILPRQAETEFED